MRVCIDQPGNKGDPAEIDHLAAIGLRADCDDPLAIDCHDAVFNRRPIDRKDDTGLQRKRHNAIVAEFARIRPSRCKMPNFCKFSYPERRRMLFRAARRVRSQRMMLLPGSGIADLLFARRLVRQSMEPDERHDGCGRAKG